MKKEERENWGQLYDEKIGEYYPLPICCGCPKHERLTIFAYHQYSGIPKFCNGHNRPMLGKHPSPETIENMRKAALKRGSVSEITKERIRRHHLGTHDSEEAKANKKRARLSWLSIPENLERLREWTREANLGKSKSDIAKENMKFSKGVVSPGPDWFKYSSEFTERAALIYGLKRSVARRRVERLLKQKKLTMRDLSLFLNYYAAGHNLDELAEHFKMSRKNIITRLKYFMEMFPSVAQEQVSAPITPQWQINYEMPDGTILELDTNTSRKRNPTGARCTNELRVMWQF